MTWRIQLMNELMELLLSKQYSDRLTALWNGLTYAGKEHIRLWAEDNDVVIPVHLKD